MPAPPSDLYVRVGRRIAAARNAQKLSQSQLATITGLSRGSVANIERGAQQPPLATLWTIGLALMIEPRSLLPTMRDFAPEETAQQSEMTKGVLEMLKGTGPGPRRALDELFVRVRGSNDTE